MDVVIKTEKISFSTREFDFPSSEKIKVTKCPCREIIKIDEIDRNRDGCCQCADVGFLHSQIMGRCAVCYGIFCVRTQEGWDKLKKTKKYKLWKKWKKKMFMKL